MTSSRRQFLLRGGLLAAGTAVRNAYAAHDMPMPAEPQVALLDTNPLARYVDELPIPTVLRSAGLRASPVNEAVRIPYYGSPCGRFRCGCTGTCLRRVCGDTVAVVRVPLWKSGAINPFRWSGSINYRAGISCR